MRHATRILVSASLAVATFAAPARADFVGLTVVREFPNQQTAVGIRDVFRVYAEFTNPNDRVDTWYGTQANPFVIQNVLANGSPGSGFFNVGGGAGAYPLPPEIPGTPYDWDTWATIGVTWTRENGGNDLAYSPDFPVFINGNAVSSTSGAIYLKSETAPQGLGSFRVSGQDTATRVLLMQITVMPGQHVQGTLNVGGRIQAGGGYVPFTASAATFISIPVPGALSSLLAAFALLARVRSRRA